MSYRSSLGGILVFLGLAYAGCGGGTTIPTCETGRYAEPGCDDDARGAAFEAGCYEACETEDERCVSGGRCTLVVENPCVCEPDEPCCDACGSDVLICL